MKIIDLSTTVEPGMPKPKAAKPVTLEYILTPKEEEMNSRGFTNKMEQYSLNTHVSTHIDASSHFNLNGRNIDQYPPEFFFMVPTQMLNIPRDELGIITAEDIQNAEKTDGEIREDDLVLLNTGWHKKFGEECFSKSPYITKDAAEYLAEKKVRMVGIDSYTVDDPREKNKPAHVVLLCQHDIPIIEFVMNLSAVPVNRFQTVCLPIKLKGASGAFTRMIGVVEEEV